MVLSRRWTFNPAWNPHWCRSRCSTSRRMALDGSPARIENMAASSACLTVELEYNRAIGPCRYYSACPGLSKSPLERNRISRICTGYLQNSIPFNFPRRGGFWWVAGGSTEKETSSELTLECVRNTRCVLAIHAGR
jgi:hypothetical protein